MRERTLMPIVDDLGLHSATDRGAFFAAEHGLITGADLMINQPRARYAVREMQQFPKVSLGVHVNFLPGATGRADGNRTLAFRSAPTPHGLDHLAKQTRDQIRRFQDMTGANPLHVSTHNHAHTDMSGQVFPKFIKAVYEAVGDDKGTVIRAVDTEQIRHCRATSLQEGIPPLTPSEFEEMLVGLRDVDKPLDLLVHPGLPLLKNQFMLLSDSYRLHLREKDLSGLVRIIESGAVQKAGYRLISPKEWLEMSNTEWPDTMWPIGPAALLSIPEELRPTQEELKDIKYPWQLLTFLQRNLHEKVKDPKGQERANIHPSAYIDERNGAVWFGRNVEVGFNAHIVGPAVIGDGSKILDGCLFSESIMGADSVIGMGSEVVRSVVGERYEAHTAKFLDSIGGDHIHLAGSAATANQRIDRGEVTIYVDGNKVSSGLPKYGAAVGSFSTFGPYSMTNPGARVGREVIVGDRTSVRGDVEDLTLLTTTKQTHERSRRRSLSPNS